MSKKTQAAEERWKDLMYQLFNTVVLDRDLSDYGLTIENDDKHKEIKDTVNTLQPICSQSGVRC